MSHILYTSYAYLFLLAFESVTFLSCENFSIMEK